MKSVTFLMHNIYAMGGTVKTISNLANELARQGHPVKIISIFQSKKQPYFELDSRVEVVSLVDYQLKIRNVIPLFANRIRKFTPLLKPKKLSKHEPGYTQFSSYVERKLIRAIQQDTSDVFVGTRASFNILLARYGQKKQYRIGMEHMNLTAHTEDFRKEILRSYTQLDAVTTLTSKDQALYQQALPETPIFIVTNMLAEKRHHMMKKNQIIAAGRFSYEKGFDLLIEAIYHIQEELREEGYTVHIFGDGTEKEALTQTINYMRLQDIVFLRPTTQQLSTHMAESKITCIPSRNEGFGLTILEAMNQGSIIVSFDENVGPSSLIQHGHNGFLVPYGNVEKLSLQLLDIIQKLHGQHLKQIKAAGYETVAAHAPEKIYEQFNNMLASLDK
ncbi:MULTISPECIES: glycosyltransferase family 4 protein [unclassified Staphylococcus]|uniref:glycosyltransferase family 4 protein n=1 Tax=unclassified Staphylococcus TaxID=91994 RepID=UPI0021D14E28|nr:MULTISPECIES: glycosyltransferase family 4 protein [unclassified Staphylococcus]UXR78089.1 glycosyltransferase family 4 protein [Staphylococcus sp. IVB6227]UXR82252.1 glycosyltransferase family 4 protein [Staphylococcus sp. IVB6214]